MNLELDTQTKEGYTIDVPESYREGHPAESLLDFGDSQEQVNEAEPVLFPTPTPERVQSEREAYAIPSLYYFQLNEVWLQDIQNKTQDFTEILTAQEFAEVLDDAELQANLLGEINAANQFIVDDQNTNYTIENITNRLAFTEVNGATYASIEFVLQDGIQESQAVFYPDANGQKQVFFYTPDQGNRIGRAALRSESEYGLSIVPAEYNAKGDIVNYASYESGQVIKADANGADILGEGFINREEKEILGQYHILTTEELNAVSEITGIENYTTGVDIFLDEAKLTFVTNANIPPIESFNTEMLEHVLDEMDINLQGNIIINSQLVESIGGGGNDQTIFWPILADEEGNYGRVIKIPIILESGIEIRTILSTQSKIDDFDKVEIVTIQPNISHTVDRMEYNLGTQILQTIFAPIEGNLESHQLSNEAARIQDEWATVRNGGNTPFLREPYFNIDRSSLSNS